MLRTELYSLKDAIEKFGSLWTDMVVGQNLNPSLRPNWMKCVSDAFGTTDAYKVVVILENDTPVGFIPYYIHRRKFSGLPVRALELGGNPVSYHQELVVTIDPRRALSEFLSSTSVHDGWHVALLGNIDDQGITHKAITELSKLDYSLYPSESSPYLPLEKNWSELLAGKKRKFRYKVNRREEDLVNNPHLKHVWYINENTSELLEAMFKIEASSWKVNEGMDITGRPIEREYYEKLLPNMAEEGLLLANVLWLKDEPIAYNLCYQQNGIVGQIKTSFDESYKHISPGATLIEASLRRYFELGYKEFDFLGDIMPHKTIWTKSVRRHNMVTVYNSTVKGRILYLVHGIKETIRQFANKAH